MMRVLVRIADVKKAASVGGKKNDATARWLQRLLMYFASNMMLDIL
jgi:hypothetical protein